uniref:Uncharacterized protein n=1 Tax=Mantoniella antarctica TaxID=81844 RepID=A0A7S0SCP0_9CHLO|mmetsp:Transcript_17634/g.43690  ORF Transcript_17634/g.43690 Transcript_17634/m.43690 type:complete len:141 (+) Transcript_17634:16-438(+)
MFSAIQNGIPKNCQCFAPPRVPSEGELNPILNDGVSLICGRLIFHRNGSSTANLWAHLKHRHPDTFVTLHPAAEAGYTYSSRPSGKFLMQAAAKVLSFHRFYSTSCEAERIFSRAGLSNDGGHEQTNTVSTEEQDAVSSS